MMAANALLSTMLLKLATKFVSFPLSTLILQSPDRINFCTVVISTVLVFGDIPRTRELIAPFILKVLVVIGFGVAVDVAVIVVCANAPFGIIIWSCKDAITRKAVNIVIIIIPAIEKLTFRCLIACICLCGNAVIVLIIIITPKLITPLR